MLKATYKFDWSMLDRYSIASFVYLLEAEIVNQTLTLPQFHKKITNHLKKHIPLRFKKQFCPKSSKGYVSIGGGYYSEYDQEKKKCIELVFVYHDKDTDITYTKKKFWNLCLLIADTILHEVIHMRQYRRRKFAILPDYNSTAAKIKVRDEQSYLGCSDEIDAYGFNIACELYEKFDGDEKKILNYLNENQKGKRRKSNSWRTYLKAFQHDHRHPIIKRVKTKVFKYLPAARIGKPYRNKDWIDR